MNSLSREFVSYHIRNPRVWQAYEEVALSMRLESDASYGIKAVTERLRWHCDKNLADEPNAFKLTNSFDPFYSRMFAAAHPEHKDLFKYKASLADSVNYQALLAGDAKGALHWDDPQLALELER